MAGFVSVEYLVLLLPVRNTLLALTYSAEMSLLLLGVGGVYFNLQNQQIELSFSLIS